MLTEKTLPKLLCAALGLCACLSSTELLAQVTLRPTDNGSPVFGPSQTHSSRQKPVSRDTNNGKSPAPPTLDTQPLRTQVASNRLSPRDYEFQQLQQEAAAMERQLNLVRRIVKFASPSIVHIEATKVTEGASGYGNKIEEAGAGVLVSLGGNPYVLTNRHVIHPASLNAIRLELNDGRLIRATDMWTDPSTDVAVLQIDRPELVTARLGDSDRMEIGDFVLAVGSPFGLSHSVTYGILSAKGRSNLELGSKEIQIQDFFQTDAAINPGNSGGPLLNLHGEIIGINTAIASNSGGNEGIGFTIPINMAMLVAEQLVRNGKLSRSYLGVQLENAFDIFTAKRLGLSSTEGALVKVVLPDSPAYRAGIRVGDVIVEFNGNRILNDGHLVKQVGLTPIGSRVTMVIYRDGTPRRVLTVLDPNPEP